jgi:hypothetical protein
MGLTRHILQDLADLKRAGLIGRGGRIADIGPQQLSDDFLCADALLCEVYELFEATPADLGGPVGAENFTLMAPWSEPFWRSLGFDYVAFDIVGENIVRLDLNRDSVPPELRHAHDIVVNGGTTEHVANQDNAFCCIHDLTKPNGLMLHLVPCQGLMTHGLVNYTLKFFWRLCRENDYQEIALQLIVWPEKPLDRNVVEFGKRFGKPIPLLYPETLSNIHILAILRKPHDRDFITPMG